MLVCLPPYSFLSFLQSTAGPLVDLLLYISSENYNSTTSSAYTAILPWYLNYTIPPARRNLARSRTAHLGLSSLDISTAEHDASKPGGRSLGATFDAAKRDAGIPEQPKGLSIGRKSGIQGLLGSPMYAARFRLDSLANELLEPLSDLLGKKNYLLSGDKPSSLDCVVFGYLALMFYPAVPQAWLKEAMQARFPRLVTYVERMREELLGGEDANAADVWAITTRSRADPEIQTTLNKLGLRLPWRALSHPSLYARVKTVSWEITRHLPVLSYVLKPQIIVQAEASHTSRKIQSSLPSPLSINMLIAFSATVTAALAGMAIQHRRSPREGELIFWALRQPASGFGEAGNILSVLAGQLATPQAF